MKWCIWNSTLTISQTTRLWPRSENSYATTVPLPILMARGVDVDEDVDVTWSVNTDTGAVEVEFEEVGDDDE